MAKLKERRNIMHTATDYINILFDKIYCKNIATIIRSHSVWSFSTWSTERMINRGDGHSGRWPIGTVANRDCDQSRLWSIETMVNRDGSQSGWWSIKTVVNINVVNRNVINCNVVNRDCGQY